MIKNGIDVIDKYKDILENKKLGLITSVSGVTGNMVSTIDVLCKKYNLTALFSPEHGVRGDMGAGDTVESYIDIHTGIKVYSLYRKDSKRITKEMLDLVDAVVYDIQDVGVRFYTFIWTMYYTMQECNKCGKEFIILDRMNPLGDKIEGNILREGYQSFVGAYPVSMRYGMTVGELAKMIYTEEKMDFPLKIVKVEGWERSMMFCDTGNIWMPPSLGIPDFETALIYAGTCLFEGTNLSEGRGTSSPFKVIGAPFVDGYKFAKHMNELHLAGVIFSPIYFTPTASKHINEKCQGVYIHITDYTEINAAITGIVLLKEFMKMYEEAVFLEPYKEGGRRMSELLFGGSEILNRDWKIEDYIQMYKEDSETFSKRKEQYHIYN